MSVGPVQSVPSLRDGGHIFFLGNDTLGDTHIVTLMRLHRALQSMNKKYAREIYTSPGCLLDTEAMMLLRPMLRFIVNKARRVNIRLDVEDFRHGKLFDSDWSCFKKLLSMSLGVVVVPKYIFSKEYQGSTARVRNDIRLSRAVMIHNMRAALCEYTHLPAGMVDYLLLQLHAPMPVIMLYKHSGDVGRLVNLFGTNSALQFVNLVLLSKTLSYGLYEYTCPASYNMATTFTTYDDNTR